MKKKIRRLDGVTDEEFARAVSNHVEQLRQYDEHCALVRAAQAAALEAEKAAAEERDLSARAEAEADTAKRSALEHDADAARGRRVRLAQAAQAAQHYPPPQAPHASVAEAVIGEQQPDGSFRFAENYELVDELPVAAGDAAGLRRRKDELLQAVARMEREALNAILPPGKQRLAEIKAREIAEADAARRADVLEAEKLPDGSKPSEVSAWQKKIAKKVEAGRPKDHAEFSAEHDARAARAAVVHRHAAELAWQVEDLTEANAHEWKPAPFPA